ncbi:MAG: hypothetical protein JKX97_08610 [Candidatus Lindowbacteria bacterium]|nr:hypothetical protein [Candidatus Lindowbacteria bacterium]
MKSLLSASLHTVGVGSSVLAAPVVIVAPMEGEWIVSGRVRYLASRSLRKVGVSSHQVDAGYTAYVAHIPFGETPQIDIYAEIGSVDVELDQNAATLLFTEVNTGQEFLWGIDQPEKRKGGL